MREPRQVFDFLRTKGSAFIAQVSDDLMKNPAFLRALETAYRGKERLDGAVGQALKTMDVPTRGELKRALARIDALEREMADRPRAAARPRKASAKRRAPARRRKAPPARGE